MKSKSKIHRSQLGYGSQDTCQAYSRINGHIVIGEGLADKHYRYLARCISEKCAELLMLGAMEGRHAVDFSKVSKNLGVKPDIKKAKILFKPLNDLFMHCYRSGEQVGCLVIQGLIMLHGLNEGLIMIGTDHSNVLDSFVEEFQQSLESAGFDPLAARRLITRSLSLE